MSDVETSIRMWREAMKELTAQAESESHAKGVAEGKRQMAAEAAALCRRMSERSADSYYPLQEAAEKIEALAPREPLQRRGGGQ